MKNIAIFEIYPNKKINLQCCIDAHLRNSIEIQKKLNADLLITELDYKNALEKSYDVLILAYASFYAPFKAISKICENNPNAKKVIISNEYSGCRTIGSFKPPYSLVANYEKSLMKNDNIEKFFSLNLNLILAKHPNKLTEKKYDCIYYSTYRPNRKKYTKEYLKKPLYISTSSKNMKKFMHDGCDANIIKKLSWVPRKETLNLFRYSLYLEDEF